MVRNRSSTCSMAKSSAQLLFSRFFSIGLNGYRRPFSAVLITPSRRTDPLSLLMNTVISCPTNLDEILGRGCSADGIPGWHSIVSICRTSPRGFSRARAHELAIEGGEAARAGVQVVVAFNARLEASGASPRLVRIGAHFAQGLYQLPDVAGREEIAATVG